jgi:hypothetical protein
LIFADPRYAGLFRHASQRGQKRRAVGVAADDRVVVAAARIRNADIDRTFSALSTGTAGCFAAGSGAAFAPARMPAQRQRARATAAGSAGVVGGCTFARAVHARVTVGANAGALARGITSLVRAHRATRTSGRVLGATAGLSFAHARGAVVGVQTARTRVRAIDVGFAGRAAQPEQANLTARTIRVQNAGQAVRRRPFDRVLNVENGVTRHGGHANGEPST